MGGALRTLSTAFVKARQTNTTTNGFSARVPQADAPSGKGDAAAQTTSAVFDLVTDFTVDNETMKNRIIIAPFGAGSDGNTFIMRVIGWRIAYERDTGARQDNAIWIPITLGDFTCTLSTPPGLAGKVVNASQLFADTIALVGATFNDDIDVSLTAPANDTIGHVVIDLKGSQKVELQFSTGGVATSCNALVAFE